MNGRSSRLQSRTDAATPAKDRRRAPVRLVGVEKRYGDVTVLGPIDLEIEPGQSVVMVGHNGSGKSTLLALVAGTLEPSDGTVQVFGEDAGSIPARASLSYLPDAPVLYDDLTVREHLEYVSRLHLADDPDRRDELIETLGLDGRDDDLPSKFSRGLRQKTAIAVGLCRPFGLLLVDEPFVGLDAAGKDAFVGLLQEALTEKATVIVATHEPSLLARFDRCLALSEGQIRYDGPPAGLPAELDADGRG